MTISGSRLSRIFTLALPIIGGMVSQNILNLVDTAMVGSLGNAALAAVGLGGFAVFLSQALLLGVSVGVQAMASRRVGEGRSDTTATPLNGGIICVWLAGVPLAAILYSFAPQIYEALSSDAAVTDLGIPYYQIRILAIMIVGTNFAFRGYWNAIDMSKLYMSTLVIMHVVNIFLNYALIYGELGFPKLGVTGAAIGTSVSTVVGAAVYMYLGFKHALKAGFLKSFPSLEEIKTLVKISLPNGIQQTFFAGGWVALYAIIGQVGTAELAASNVLINVMLVAILPSIGLGIAAATLVGQALGRKDVDDAYQWGLDVTKVGVVGLSILGIIMAIFPVQILGIFIHDQATIDIAAHPMRLSGYLMPFEAIGLILMNALLGAGDSKRVMITSIAIQWGYFLPAAYVLGVILNYGLLEIWFCNGTYRVAAAVAFGYFWHQRGWTAIKL